MKRLLTIVCATLVPALAHAQPALDQLGAESGTEVRALNAQTDALRTNAGKPVGIPLQRRDLFANCGGIDAQTLRAFTLPEAVKVVQGCIDASGAAPTGRNGATYKVTAKAGRFGVSACPNAAPGTATCHAMVEVIGIIIAVEGRILTGSAILADLVYSVQKRGGKLLGFYATVDSSKANLNPAAPSPTQPVFDAKPQ